MQSVSVSIFSHKEWDKEGNEDSVLLMPKSFLELVLKNLICTPFFFAVIFNVIGVGFSPDKLSPRS